MNLLFPSSGRRVELLRAFSASISRLGGGKVVATDIDPLAPTFQIADRTYLVPRIGSEGYVSALIEICRREGIHAVVPLLDADVQILSAHREQVEETGARVLIMDPSAIAIASDKVETSIFFGKLGLDTPRWWTPTDCNLNDLEYPVFIKPRRGAASKDSYKIDDAAALAFYSARIPSLIVQEFIGGAEITTDVISDYGGRVLAIVSRQRIEVRNGEVSKGVTVQVPEIHEACLRISKALPSAGAINIQCIMRGDRPSFTEINARLGGGVPLAIAAGVDVPTLLLAGIAGTHVDQPPLARYEVGLHMTRYDESFVIREAKRATVASGNLRSR
jgi:carbamoyl-phosphate synthase large subunit